MRIFMYVFITSISTIFSSCSSDQNLTSTQSTDGTLTFNAQPGEVVAGSEIISLEGYQVLTSNLSELFYANRLLRESQQLVSCFALKASAKIEKRFLAIRGAIIPDSVVYETVQLSNYPGKVFFFSNCLGLEDFGDVWYSGITLNNTPDQVLNMRTYYPSSPNDTGFIEIYEKISIPGSTGTNDVVMGTASMSFNLGLNYLWFDHLCGLPQNRQDINIIMMAIASDHICNLVTDIPNKSKDATEFMLKAIELR